MKTFEIENIASGIVLGQYEAEDILSAMMKLAEDAGEDIEISVHLMIDDKNIVVKEI